MSDTTEEITEEDVLTMPPSEESFDGEAVTILVDLVQNQLAQYVKQQADNDEPVSLIGFGMELIYQIGYKDGQKRRR